MASALEKNTTLQTLDLGDDYTQVTDSGLEHLKGLTNLQTLNVRGALITDAADGAEADGSAEDDAAGDDTAAEDQAAPVTIGEALECRRPGVTRPPRQDVPEERATLGNRRMQQFVCHKIVFRRQNCCWDWPMTLMSRQVIWNRWQST